MREILIGTILMALCGSAHAAQLTADKFTIAASGTTIKDSIMTQSSALVSVAGSMTLSGDMTAAYYHGNGSLLTGVTTDTSSLVPKTTKVAGHALSSDVLIDEMVYPGAGIPLSTGSAWGTSITNSSTSWNDAYTDRLKWDGGSTGLTAAAGRTSLGLGTAAQSASTDFLAAGGTAVNSSATASDSTWTTHSSYPTGCSAGQYVQAIGDTLTCAADLTGGGGSISGLTPGKLTYASSSTTIADSIVSQAGSLLSITGSMSVSGQATFPQVNATTFVGALTGNASTVTNGVYTTGAGTVYLTPSGSAASLTSFPTLNQNTTGSAATLTTARTINGKSFNGSANITIGQNDIDLSLYAPKASPTLTTPTLGVATATSVNKVTITAPASSATLTIADGKTLTATNTVNLNTMTDGKACTYTASGTVINCATTLPTGTVTSVSVTSNNGVSGSVATSTTSPAITLTLGAITPSALTVSGQTTLASATTSGNLSVGTTATTKTLTVSGDMTLSGSATFGTSVIVNGSGYLIPTGVTADPCATQPEGTMFYNSTGHFYCFCNNSGVDVKITDNSTACY